MLILTYYWLGVVHALLEVTIFEFGPVAKWINKRLKTSFRKLGLDYEDYEEEVTSKSVMSYALLWPIYVLCILVLITIGKDD